MSWSNIPNGSTTELNDVDRLRERAISSITQSSMAVEKLRDAPSQSTAESACSACRKAVQLVFFARGRLGDASGDQMDHLYENLDTAIDIVSDLGHMQGVDSVVLEYVHNLEWRRDLVFALKASDKEAINRLLLE